MHIEMVLKRLIERGCQAKASKCKFAFTKVQYLGPDPEKVAAVRNYPAPTTTAKLRAFLDSFPTSPKSPNLYRISYRTEHVLYGVQNSKERLTNSGMFSRRIPFSNSPTGINLLSYRPTHQPSASVQCCHRRAPITESESCSTCLVKHHQQKRPYLLGNEFTLITDNSALKWILQSVNNNHHLRMSLALQEYYPFTVPQPTKQTSEQRTKQCSNRTRRQTKITSEQQTQQCSKQRQRR